MAEPPNSYVEADDSDAPPRLTEQELNGVLDESEADIIAGRVSPWPEARARLMAILAELEAERAKRRA